MGILGINKKSFWAVTDSVGTSTNEYAKIAVHCLTTRHERHLSPAYIVFFVFSFHYAVFYACHGGWTSIRACAAFVRAQHCGDEHHLFGHHILSGIDCAWACDVVSICPVCLMLPCSLGAFILSLINNALIVQRIQQS